ncbi:hypothetical protein HDR59_01765 [bacterium]|nr:hypothetical protein [bacterium]
MKKFFILFLIIMCSFANVSFSQNRARGGRRVASGRGNGFTFSQDAKDRIKVGCQSVMRKAQQFSREMKARGKSDIESEIVYMCSVNSIELEKSDLGPWEKFVYALEKVFKQFRRLIYIAAVFMLLWILVKAMYEGDMKWMHIGMMLIGVTMLAFAEVFLDIATNRVTIDDIRNSEIYVDCREPDKGLYRCSVEVEGAVDKESIYLFDVNHLSAQSKTFKGLY